jgi:hypothetical protein
VPIADPLIGLAITAAILRITWLGRSLAIAMEPKAVEVVTAIYGAWNAGDWGLEHFHPNVEWELTGQGTIDQAGPSRGRDSLLDYWRRFWAAWKPGARWDIDKLERTAEDQVLASGHLHAVGRTSGARTSDARIPPVDREERPHRAFAGLR